MRALYRRYRPKSLEEVVGQAQVTEPLMKSLAAGKVGHAYLFVGPRGCGKTSVARILAHEVNGFKYELEDDYVDIIEIDGASNRGIDDIRELREKVMIAPTVGKYKVYIIDEVHMLTKEAFNALLKTLEEPPAHAIFIMATTDAYKVPVTITSRAQTYTFKLADGKMMLDFLKSIAEAEKINIASDALEIIAKRGGGSFRDSLSLLDQISALSDDEITREMVVNALGLPQDNKIAALVTEYANGNIAGIAAVLRELLSSGVKAETLTEEIIAYILEHPQPELMPLLAKLPDVKAPYAEARLLAVLALQEGMTPARPPMRAAQQPSQISAPPRAATSHAANSAPVEEEASSAANTAPATTKATTTPPREASANFQFDWNTYINKVQELNDAVGMQLKKVKYEFDGETLHIYPGKRIIKSILARENNKRILIDAASGQVKITIHDENDTPNTAEKDETLSKISDIMGGEVQNDGGGSPF